MQVTSAAILNGFGTGWLHPFIDAIGFTHSYNPVGEWIRSREWDGTDRLQELYDTVLEAEEYPKNLKETLLKRWLLSAARAALAKQHFKARGVLTLHGPQGIGKTTWISMLIPEVKLRNECILLDHHLDTANKDSIINAINHWVVEIGELDSSFKKDIARLKGFLTNDCDKLRKPYGKEVMWYPRRTVFAATVNEEQFLVDPTGNSRWWTISVRGLKFKHTIDMQQLFAQLAVLLGEDEKWWLTKAEETQLALYNVRHRSVSAIADRIAAYFNLEAMRDGHGTYMTPTEVLMEMGISNPSNAQAKECGAALRELVGGSKRVNGRDKWRVLAMGERVPSRSGNAF
jgi:putative DNA primase/helicase